MSIEIVIENHASVSRASIRALSISSLVKTNFSLTLVTKLPISSVHQFFTKETRD